MNASEKASCFPEKVYKEKACGKHGVIAPDNIGEARLSFQLLSLAPLLMQSFLFSFLRQRSVRKAAALAGEAAQGEDAGDEADAEPGLRRGLHLLRSPLQPARGEEEVEKIMQLSLFLSATVRAAHLPTALNM